MSQILLIFRIIYSESQKWGGCIMKLKSLTAILATALMIVCLAGCTGSGNAGGASSDSDTRLVAEAAVAYGMKEKDFNDVMDLMTEYENEGSAYYVSKNVNDAQGIFLQLATIGKELSANVTEVTVAAANENLGTGNFETYAVQFTFTDADSAKKYYDYEAFYFQDLGGEVTTGEKDGFTYTLSYFEGSVLVAREGQYLKGNTVIFISANTTVDYSGDCFATVVFDDIGVVDPAVLK